MTPISGLIYRPEIAPSSYDAEAAPEDEGVAGARMAVKDNNTTGRFTKQTYALDEVALTEGRSAVDAARDLVGKGIRYLVLALPADEVLAVADAVKGEGVTVFNTAAPDDRLRGAECRKNVFHVIPSRAMQTDALAQFFTLMRWRKMFLIVGPNDNDKLYADAFRASAQEVLPEDHRREALDFRPARQGAGRHADPLRGDGLHPRRRLRPRHRRRRGQ